MDSPPDGVVPARPEMLPLLAAEMDPDHQREIAALSGLSPLAALTLSLAGSAETYVFMPRSCAEPVFVMGVEPAGYLTRTARVWMLGTPAIRRHPAAVLRAARWGVARAFAAAGADELEQYLPEWYRTGLRFVRRLGFVFGPAVPDGRGGRWIRAAVRRQGK